MNAKAKSQYWIDVSMGLLALVLAVSSALLWVVLPQGFFATRLLWIQIHKWVGLGLSILALIHMALHWRWLVRMTRHLWRPSRSRAQK
jgi:hypothetical protein